MFLATEARFAPMCRSIKTLRNAESPATGEEIRARRPCSTSARSADFDSRHVSMPRYSSSPLKRSRPLPSSCWQNWLSGTGRAIRPSPRL